MKFKQTATAIMLGAMLLLPSLGLAVYAGSVSMIVTEINAATGVYAGHNNSAKSANKVKVIGTLTDEGTECQAMRGDDGNLYTLKGDLKDFHAGDRVKVVGEVAEVSTCMQGTTLKVRKIKEAK